MYIIIKTLISAIIIVLVSEVAKRSTLFAALIISIPLTSLLAFIWLYIDTKSNEKIIALSYSTIIMTIPSFVFFILLPLMIKLKQTFAISLIISILGTMFSYFIFLYLIKKMGINF